MVKRLGLIFVFLILFSSLYPKTTFAASNCEIVHDPPNLIQNTPPLTTEVSEDKRWFKFWITVNDRTPGVKYKVVFREATLGIGEIARRDLTPNSEGVLIQPDGNPPGIKYNPVDPLVEPKTHNFYVEKEGIGRYCDGSYTIKPDMSGGIKSCKLEFDPPDPDETKSITLKGEILPPGKYSVKIPNRTYSPFITEASAVTSGSIPPVNLGKFNPGLYDLTIQKVEISGDATGYGEVYIDTNCQAKLNIAKAGESGSAGQVGTPGPGGTIPVPPQPPARRCPKKDETYDPDKHIDPKLCALAGGDPCSNDPKDPNPGFKTAIGCVHTNPVALVKDILTFAVAISGGLAFLMMLLGAYQMLTSQGNPETLIAGKDRLTNAVIGLLFVIFSVLLMQIIGFDILKIPGFGL